MPRRRTVADPSAVNGEKLVDLPVGDGPLAARRVHALLIGAAQAGGDVESLGRRKSGHHPGCDGLGGQVREQVSGLALDQDWQGRGLTARVTSESVNVLRLACSPVAVGARMSHRAFLVSG